MENNNIVIIKGEEYSLPNFLAIHKTKIISKSDDFEKNVFIMIKYRDNNQLLREHIGDILMKNNLNCVYADDPQWRITDDIYNPLAVLCCCKYGIAIFDTPEKNQNFNPNVAYELGIMHFQKKECLILINSKIINAKPFDLLAKLHKSYTDSLETENLINSWLIEIGIGSKNKNQPKEVIVVAAVVRKKDTFLITERAIPEKKFKWGFPTGRIDKDKIEDKDYIKKRLCDECFQETNIKIKPQYEIGERIHPDTGVRIIYWYCDYVSGRKKVKDPTELKDVEWMKNEEVLTFFETNVFNIIKKTLLKY